MKELYELYTVTENNAHFSFRRFHSENFDMKYAVRSGRPLIVNVDEIIETVNQGRHMSSVRLLSSKISLKARCTKKHDV